MIVLSKKGTKPFFYIYSWLVFTWMCISNQTLYTNYIPSVLILLLSVIPVFLFIYFSSENGVKKEYYAIIVLLSIVYFQLLIKNPNVSLFRTFVTIGCIFNISTIFVLSSSDKLNLLDTITDLFVVCLCFSIAGWVMKLAGHPLPVIDYVDFNDDVHYLNNCIVYYDNPDVFFLPRFRAFFIEPGQLATPCVYLFFARGAKIADWKNIILLAALLLSFSLAGYVTLFVGLILKNIFVSHKLKFIRLLAFTVIVGGISYFTVKIANEDNPLYSLIFQRLEYDENSGIAGNNRSDEVFEYYFAQYVKSGKIVFGIGDELPEGDANWANHASGIKKFFLNYGLIGVLSMLLLTVKILKINYCRENLVFFIVLWTAYIVRDLLQSQFWLIIAILGFYNLKHDDYIFRYKTVSDKTKFRIMSSLS